MLRDPVSKRFGRLSLFHSTFLFQWRWLGIGIVGAAILVVAEISLLAQDLSAERAASALTQYCKDRSNSPDWHCKIRIEGSALVGSKSISYLEYWEIWVSGAKIKAIPLSESLGSNWKEAYFPPGKLCVGCSGLDVLVHFGLNPEPMPSAISVYDVDVASSQITILDPRLVGLLPFDMGNVRKLLKLDPYFLDEKDVDVESSSDGSFVVSPTNNRFGFTYTVKQFASSVIPIRVERHYDLGKEKIDELLTIEHVEHGGFWIPKFTVLSEDRNGVRTREERCSVETLSYAVPLDKSVFELKSLSLPVRNSVNWASSVSPPIKEDEVVTFDGENFVGVKFDLQRHRPEKPASVSTVPRTIFLIVNVLVLIAAVVFVSLRLTRRNSNK